MGLGGRIGERRTEPSHPQCISTTGEGVNFASEQKGQIRLMIDIGQLLGWSMSPRHDRHLVVQTVLMAVWQRPGRTPVILHSDRGCQFTSEEY